MRLVALVLVSAWILSIPGCGGGRPKKPVEKVVPVTGKVTFNGKPEAGIGVVFNPTGKNTASHGGHGVTDPDGSFKMKNYAGLDGVPAGTYTVTFTWTEVPEGMDRAAVKKKPIPGISTKEKIPPKWNDVLKKGKHNFVDIPDAGASDLKFDITDK